MSEESVKRTIKCLIRNILWIFERLSNVPDHGPDGFNESSTFYMLAYDLGRHMYLYKDYRSLFTDEEKKAYREMFPSGFLRVSGFTSGLNCNQESDDLNFVKGSLSEMSFVKHELLDLYNELAVVDGDQTKFSDDIKLAVQILDEQTEVLLEQISEWEKTDCYSTIDSPDDVPDLRGVPESHSWWPSKHRDMWNNRENMISLF